MVTEILKLIYLVLIGPLQLLFEFLFSISYDLTRNAGISIIILSIAMNLLALPLYRRADALQNEQSEKLKAVSGWQERIRKTFKGDERFMMLNAFNREKGIRPTDALKGSASLLLEIPFFIAAYKMLSSLALLSGKSFGPIKDMGTPDGLINMGVISVNVLPLLMTAINILSSSIYLKDSDRKSKIQLYGIAAIFLILLFVVVIIALNIFGSLSMLVIEKKDDIATLRAMGADDSLIRRIFVLEGWLISLLGMAVGVALGVGLTLLQQHFGLVKMPGNFVVDAYPVVLRGGDVLLSAAGVAFIGLLVALAPALSRSK